MPVNGSENDGLLQLKRRDQSRASHDSLANLTPSPLTSEGRKRGREVKRGCWSAEPNSFEDFLSSRSLFLPRLFFRFSPNELSRRFPVELQRPTPPPPPPPGVVFVCGADPSVRPLSLSRCAPRQSSARTTHTFSSTQHFQQQAFRRRFRR